MKYTVKSFIRQFFSKQDLLDTQKECGGDIYLRWDGSILEVIDKNPKRSMGYQVLDCVCLCKEKPNMFLLDLESRHYWYFTIEFRDGGFKKNKWYRVKDYL